VLVAAGALGACVAAGIGAVLLRPASTPIAGPAPPGGAVEPAGVAATAAVSSALPPHAVGTRLRLHLSHWSSVEIDGTASIGSLSFTFDARVEEVTGDESRWGARFAGLRALFQLRDTGAPPLEFDSDRPDEATAVFQPLRRLSDVPFAIQVDHARGDVLRVAGLDEPCDQALAEVTRSLDLQDSTSRTLLAMFKTLLTTLRDERVRELLDVLLDVGPLQPDPRWTRERALRTGLSTIPHPMSVELRRDGPRHLRWRLKRGEEDGFEASGEWDLDAEGRVVAATVEDLSTRSGAQWARVERRFTLRLEVMR